MKKQKELYKCLAPNYSFELLSKEGINVNYFKELMYDIFYGLEFTKKSICAFSEYLEIDLLQSMIWMQADDWELCYDTLTEDGISRRLVSVTELVENSETVNQITKNCVGFLSEHEIEEMNKRFGLNLLDVCKWDRYYEFGIWSQSKKEMIFYSLKMGDLTDREITRRNAFNSPGGLVSLKENKYPLREKVTTAPGAVVTS